MAQINDQQYGPLKHAAAPSKGQVHHIPDVSTCVGGTHQDRRIFTSRCPSEFQFRHLLRCIGPARALILTRPKPPRLRPSSFSSGQALPPLVFDITNIFKHSSGGRHMDKTKENQNTWHGSIGRNRNTWLWSLPELTQMLMRLITEEHDDERYESVRNADR